MKPPHTRLCTLPFHWPEPPLQVALIEPEIPPNTGNIARLCAATGTRLHLVGRLGFRLNDATLRRAGLDYWDAVDLERHADLAALFQRVAPAPCYFFSTRGAINYASVHYQPGDTLVFGCETRGLPEELLNRYPDRVIGIPIRSDRVRSLNLANAVAIVLYEALSQFQTPEVSGQTTDRAEGAASDGLVPPQAGRQTTDDGRQRTDARRLPACHSLEFPPESHT